MFTGISYVLSTKQFYPPDYEKSSDFRIIYAACVKYWSTYHFFLSRHWSYWAGVLCIMAYAKQVLFLLLLR